MDSARLRDYATNLWVEVTLNGFGFLSGILLARWLGPTLRGQLAAAMLWPGIIGIVVTLGLQQAFAYAVGVGWATPRQLHKLAWRFSLFVGVPTMFAYWITCPWLLYDQFPDEIWVPRIFVLYIPAAIYAGFLLPIYQGVGDFQRWNIARIFRSGAWTLTVTTLALFAALSVLNLLVAQIVIILITGAYLWSRLTALEGNRPGYQTFPLKPIFKYGFAVYLSGLAYTINQQLDQLLLSLWVSSSELGQYTAAVTLSSMVLVIPSAIGAIAFSKISGAIVHPAEQRHHIRLTLAWGVTLLVPTGLTIALLAPWFTFVLFGPDYVHSGELLRVLAPAATSLGIGMLLAEVLRGLGKPVYATYGAILGAAITVGGLAITLPKFGTWAAAWVSFAAYTSMMLVEISLLRRLILKDSSLASFGVHNFVKRED